MKSSQTRKKLLESGKKFFLEYGFQSAPLRRIVADAGYTQGAFYGYFNTKEDLFYALTDPFVEQTMELLDLVQKEMTSIPASQRLYQMGATYRRYIPQIASHFHQHREELELLLDKAEGTKYANFFTVLAQRNLAQVEEALSENFPLSPPDNKMLHILIGGYFSMVGQIVLEEQEEENMRRMLNDIQIVYENGIVALFRQKSL